MNQTFESFLAKRLINEYTGLCNKHKTEHKTLAPKEFSNIPIFLGRAKSLKKNGLALSNKQFKKDLTIRQMR